MVGVTGPLIFLSTHDLDAVQNSPSRGSMVLNVANRFVNSGTAFVTLGKLRAFLKMNIEGKSVR